MRNLIFAFCLFTLALIYYGCSSSTQSTKGEPPSPPLPVVTKSAVPDISVNVANLDLTSVSKKIEKNDLEQLAKILKEKKVDILAVQGITRYPNLKNRLDLLAEIPQLTEMRMAFGENINVSGRQTGNAVFSTYPIRSNDNTHYEKIRSSNFESVLQAVIDCGVKDVVVISTHLPDEASSEDMNACIATLSSFRTSYQNQPIIVNGNLPASDVFKNLSGYTSSQNQSWFTGERQIILQKHTVEQSPLGPMNVTEFGIYGKPKP